MVELTDSEIQSNCENKRMKFCDKQYRKTVLTKNYENFSNSLNLELF